MPITVFSHNLGGIDISSSPLSVADNAATGQSYNYEYAQTGAITKVLAAKQLNSSPDAQLNTLGLGSWHDVATDTRTVVRAAGTKLQTFSLSSNTATNLTDDTTAANTDFLNSSSIQPVVFSPFNTLTGGTQLWMAGGGMNGIYGYYGSKVTKNGVPAPTGNITATQASDSGTFVTTGTYYYAVQYRKLSTQTFSNVALDVSATISATTDQVTIDLTGITNNDTTLYDQIWIYRSAVNGSSGFTTGSIIAKLASTSTTYVDTGDSIVSSQNVARAGNTVLDNSALDTANTYKYITVFKRRLVTAYNSEITVATGGPITGLAVLGIPSEYTTGAEEYLCIFKERELWILQGTSSDDWELKIVDKTGCQIQTLIVPFNGFLTWIGINGIFIWDGKGRPSRVSRPIFALFAPDGDLDLGNLNRGYGAFYESKNQVIWRLSHHTKGVNKFSIKMDIRNTNSAAGQNLEQPEMDGVFIFDSDSNQYSGLLSFRQSNFQEILLAGDQSGNIYQHYSDAPTAVSFDYETKSFHMGNPDTLKQFNRVLVWIERLTPNDLTCYYWADNRIRMEYQSVVKVSMAPSKGAQPALWDIALWDQAFWDDYVPDISPIEFNLHSYENNNVGTSLKLKFEQLEGSAPVRIHAFAIDWEEVGNLPIPTQQIA